MPAEPADPISDIVCGLQSAGDPLLVLEEQGGPRVEGTRAWYVASSFDLFSQGQGSWGLQGWGRPVCMSILQGTMSLILSSPVLSGRGVGAQDTDIPGAPHTQWVVG